MKNFEMKNKGLSVGNLVLLICIICSIVMPTALAKNRPIQSPASIGGVYGDFTVGKGSGDLEGMRVVIFARA